jgi:hypothetical protein
MSKICQLAGALGASIAISFCGTANGATSYIEVGVAAKVVNYVYGTPESTHQPRWWRPGLDAFHNEFVVTQDASASRVVFKDNSQLSIGPISQIKLDSYVYDPNPSLATVSISFVKGVFRFVGGLVSRENYQISTPAAKIALRGTAFTVLILENGSEYIAVESGTIYVTCHQGLTVALNAGQMTYISSPQGSASAPQRATPIGPVVQMDSLLQ